MRHATVCAFLSLLLACLPQPSLARAQEARDSEAGTRFDRGLALYGEGNLDAALVEFERAYELVPHHRVLYNLAQIQAERHEYAAAVAQFERYLRDGGSELPEARRAEVREQTARLRERVAELWVESDVRGASLLIDEEVAATLPLSAPVLIDSGLRRVMIDKPGYQAETRRLKVAGGDRPRLTIRLRPLSELGASGATAKPAAESLTVPNYAPVWTSSASALALAGATLTFGLLARRADRELDRELDRYPTTTERLDRRRAELKTYAGLTDGFAAATGLALGLAIYFAIDPPLLGRESAQGGSLRLLPGDRGLALRGAF